MDLHGVSGHPEPDSEHPLTPKLKISPRLNRWSVARALRSGVKIDRPIHNTPRRQVTEEKASNIDGGCDDVEIATGKSIYLVSDGTGWTAEHSVNAALGQFEDFMLNRRGSFVNTHLFSWVSKIHILLFFLGNSIIKHDLGEKE